MDNCAVAAKVPEMLNAALTNPSPFTANVYQLAISCRKEESWQTQVRGFATYIIPKADVLISGIFRFQPNSTFGVGATPEGNSTGLSANYADARQRRGHEGQPARRPAVLRRPHQPDRHAVRQDRQLRQQAREHRGGRAEPVQREHRDRISSRTTTTNYLNPTADPQPAVRPVQRDGRLLRIPYAPRPNLWMDLCIDA